MKFAIVRFFLALLYALENPYRICRKSFERLGEKHVHAYGETPLSVWERIARLAEIGPDDVFVDLGCGRGLLCFWTALFLGARTIGIDWVGTFIRRARFLARLLRCKNLEFAKARMTAIPLHQVTAVYLYTFHRDEEAIDLSALPKGARVITVSEPLQRDGFLAVRSEIVDFPWGESEVFVNVRG